MSEERTLWLSPSGDRFAELEEWVIKNLSQSLQTADTFFLTGRPHSSKKFRDIQAELVANG